MSLILSSSAQNTLFVHERQPLPEWRKALWDVVPRIEGLSWFDYVWEPGEPHDPIQRWMIWQFQDKAATKRMILNDDPRAAGLTEEHPRKNASWNEAMGCYAKPDGSLAKTDKLTWELYHATGCVGHRFWVVQGDRGGHRYNLSAVEKQVLYAGSKGKIKDVPLPGALPYCDPDSRVLPHFQKIEQAAMARKIHKYASSHYGQLDADEIKEAEYARSVLFDWLGEQMGEMYDEFKPYYKEMLRKTPVAVGAKPVHTDGAELKERYVKQG